MSVPPLTDLLLSTLFLLFFLPSSFPCFASGVSLAAATFDLTSPMATAGSRHRERCRWGVNHC